MGKSGKDQSIAEKINKALNEFKDTGYKKAIDAIEKNLSSVKENPAYKEGLKYINNILDEVDKSSRLIENKIKISVRQEKKKLEFYLSNLGKYLDKLSEQVVMAETKKSTKKKTVKKAKKKKAAKKKK